MINDQWSPFSVLPSPWRTKKIHEDNSGLRPVKILDYILWYRMDSRDAVYTRTEVASHTKYLSNVMAFLTWWTASSHHFGSERDHPNIKSCKSSLFCTPVMNREFVLIFWFEWKIRSGMEVALPCNLLTLLNTVFILYTVYNIYGGRTNCQRTNAKWFIGIFSGLFCGHLAFCPPQFFLAFWLDSQRDRAFCPNDEIHS